MKKKYTDCISSVVLILFGLWGWYETSHWKVSVSSGGLNPKTYPRILFTAIIILSAVILVRTLILLWTQRKGAEELERKIPIYLRNVVGSVVLFVVYILALRAFGFLFTTPVFLFLSMLLYGERRWLRMVIISVAGAVALELFFVQLMRVHF